MRIGPADVLQLGDPALRVVSAPVVDVREALFRRQSEVLHAVLDTFREERGFGRAIAAPQIGIPRRFIAVRLGDERLTIVDPEIVARSAATFTLWDDCMSFPELLVHVRRHEQITVRYTDEQGRRVERVCTDRAEAELLQHEIDHLDGVLAVDHLIDPYGLVTREAFERDPEFFLAQVD